MRFRANNNAASAGCSIVAFLVGGCGVAAVGVLAGFEAYVLKAGVIAYLFMAVPLFLASLFAGLTGPGHKSSRGTPPASMEGKRVKRRLLRLWRIASLSSMGALLLTFFGELWALHRFGYRPDRAGLVLLVVVVGPLAACGMTWAAFKFLFVKFGWLTPEEARSWRDIPLEKVIQ